MRLLPAMFTFRRNPVIGRALAVPEPADMGTAFGLDACLMGNTPQAAPGVDDDDLPSEPPLAWLSRLRRAR